MAWTTARILLQLSSHRVQRQSFASTTPDGGQRRGPIGTLESESGTKLNMDGFPRASKGSYMECLFSKWLRDNSSIHGTWHRFFKELVANKALDCANDLSSTQSDSGVQPEREDPRQEDTLPTQPKLDSVLPPEESVIKVPEQMILQKTPEEPEKAAKREQKASLRYRRRIPKFTLFQKFAKFRRQASSMKKTDKSLHGAQRIPGSKCGRKWRTKGKNTMQFKSYHEEKMNKQIAKDKENKELEKPQGKPQEKPQPSQLGEEASDLNQPPKTLAYESLVALIHDLDNSTDQEKLKKMQPFKDWASTLSKMPSDIKSFTDLPRALIDHPEKTKSNSEDKVLMSENKATESLSSDETTAGPQPENLSGRPQSQSPLGDVVTNKEPQTGAPSQQSSDP